MNPVANTGRLEADWCGRVWFECNSLSQSPKAVMSHRTPKGSLTKAIAERGLLRVRFPPGELCILVQGSPGGGVVLHCEIELVEIEPGRVECRIE